MLLAKGCTFGSADSICKLAHQLVCFVFETDTLANVQRDENDDTFRILNENLYIFFQVIGFRGYHNKMRSRCFANHADFKCCKCCTWQSVICNQINGEISGHVQQTSNSKKQVFNTWWEVNTKGFCFSVHFFQNPLGFAEELPFTKYFENAASNLFIGAAVPVYISMYVCVHTYIYTLWYYIILYYVILHYIVLNYLLYLVYFIIS